MCVSHDDRAHAPITWMQTSPVALDRRDDAGYVRPSIANDSRFGVQDQQRYVLANPFAGIKVRGAALRPALDTARGFTETEWLLIRTRLSVSAKPRGDLAERGAAIVLTYLGAPFVRRPITHGGPSPCRSSCPTSRSERSRLRRGPFCLRPSNQQQPVVGFAQADARFGIVALKRIDTPIDVI